MPILGGSTPGYRPGGIVTALACAVLLDGGLARSSPVAAEDPGSQPPPTQACDPEPADPRPAEDLALEPAGARKAEALARLMLAIALENAGERAKAIAAYRRSLDLDPANVDLCLRVADELVRRGQSPDAIDLLKNSAQAAPKHPAPLVRLADIYASSLDKPDVALRHARLAAERAPEDFEAFAILHRLLIANGQIDEAAQLLQRAENSKSADPSYWTRLGALLAAPETRARNGDPQRAYERANRAYERAIEIDAENTAALSAAADHFVLTQQVHLAIPLYLKIVRVDPDSHTARNKLVRSLLSTGQRKRAIEVLEEMLQGAPPPAYVYEILGQLLIDEREFARAADTYRQSLSLNPNQPTNYRRAATLFLEIREPEKAIEILRQARARFPEQTELAIDLAAALGAARQYDEALPILAEILARAERDEPELLTFQLLYLNAGIAYQARDWDGAAKLYKRAIEIDPENAAPAYNDLGYMWVERGVNLDEAAQLIRRAIELDPANGAYHDSLGWLHFQRGAYREALPHLLKAAAAPPGKKEAHDEFLGTIFDHIGDTYMRLGEPLQALVYWQKAIEHQPALQAVHSKIENARQNLPATSPSPTPASATP